jgi:aerobic carbon-monoxide dehydrogenase small subunit
MRVQLTVNGVPFDGDVEPRLLLADLLRDRLGLTGTHIGCEHGICGACTVQVDGEPARSCLMFAAQASGAEIATVEGLAGEEDLHPLQEALHRHHALQCGFCTPGFLMSIEPLLPDVPGMDEEELRGRLAGNLCRCTGYQPIIEATQATATATGSQTRIVAVEQPVSSGPPLDWEAALDGARLLAALPGASPARHVDAGRWRARIRTDAGEHDVSLRLLDTDDGQRTAHLQVDARDLHGPGRLRAGVELSLAEGTLGVRVSARAFAMPQLPEGEPLTAMLAAVLRRLADRLPPAEASPAAPAAGGQSRTRSRVVAGLAGLGLTIAIAAAVRARRSR